MPIEFFGGQVRVIERSAGELKLSSRLERDGALAVRVIEADQVAPVLDALPAEMAAHALQERPDSPFTPVRNGRMAPAIKGDLLVLRADPERARRFAPGLKPGDQRIAQLNNFTIDDVASHSGAHPHGRRTGEPAR